LHFITENIEKETSRKLAYIAIVFLDLLVEITAVFCGSSGDIENVTTAITAVSEAYPELKANENYKELMNELSITSFCNFKITHSQSPNRFCGASTGAL